MKHATLTTILGCVTVLILETSCTKDKKPTDISTQYTVITLAGSGVRGSVDGPATNAQFYQPNKIAADGLGNVYVSDVSRYCVRKITKDGMVSTFAGGTKGKADGSGASAQFTRPGSLAVDAQNNVYVADSERIRKITPSGNVTSVTGDLIGGIVNTGVGFYEIGGIAVDRQGNIFAITTAVLKSQILKITPGGGMSVFIDTAQNFATVGFLSTLHDITIDASGNILVTRNVMLEYEIYRITPSKMVTLVATTPDILGLAIDPNSGEVIFTGPTDCLLMNCVKHWNVYKINSSAASVNIAGGEKGFADGTGNVARFNVAAGISADPQGNLYVADQENNRVRKISRN